MANSQSPLQRPVAIKWDRKILFKEALAENPTFRSGLKFSGSIEGGPERVFLKDALAENTLSGGDTR